MNRLAVIQAFVQLAEAKELAAEADSDEKLKLFMQIFDIEEEAGRQLDKSLDNRQTNDAFRMFAEKFFLSYRQMRQLTLNALHRIGLDGQRLLY
jgi:hypothetical protein